jgi:very-short-patch-repair endonuclease
MLLYRKDLKIKSRTLRKNLTDSERILWSRLRTKQIMDVQFYRQKPIGNYIVDFYAPRANLVVEVDGSQHKREGNMQKDEARDLDLENLGLKVLRFNSREVIKETDAVLEVIYKVIGERLRLK